MPLVPRGTWRVWIVWAWLSWPAVASAEVPSCVEVETALVRGMFLCGAHAELRVVVRDGCAEPVACTVTFADGRSGPTRIEIDPGGEVGSLTITDRRRVPTGTTGCFDAAPHDDPVVIDCVMEPERIPREAFLPAPVTPSPLGPATSPHPPPPASIRAATPRAIRATDADERALAEIPLEAGDSAYRGGAWHVRFGIGAGYELAPVFTNRQRLVGIELVRETRPIWAQGSGLAFRFAIEPYRDEVVAVGVAGEAALGVMPQGEGMSLLGSGMGLVTLALGYRWVFALVDGGVGGRAVGLVDALDPSGFEISAGSSLYARARLGGGVRFCLASSAYHGCPAELDLTAHWERALITPSEHVPTIDALLLGASVAIDGVLTASIELGWDYPVGGEAIVAPRDPIAGLVIAARLLKQFDWFGEAYAPPEVPCAPDVLTGIWRTPDGDRVLVEESGDAVVLRSASVEGLGRREGTDGMRIEWATDRGRAVDLVTIATPDVLVRDGETVLSRVCR